MSRRTIRWTRRALRRLDQIGDHIGRESPAAAAAVVGRIVTAIGHLADQPASGRPGRVDGTRELVLGEISYIVAYRVTPASIDVLTIIHTAQRWPDSL